MALQSSILPPPFSKKFPSWSHLLSGHSPVVGPGSYFRASSETLSYHRQTFRSGENRFWGWSSNAERWKRSVPQGIGVSGIEEIVPPFLSLRAGVG